MEKGEGDRISRCRGGRALVAGALLAPLLSGCAWISRVSESSSGAPADSETPLWSMPSISADGRYVAFDSNAGNLVGGADGGVFVRDTRSGSISAVSVRSDGSVDDFADTPAISGNGRFVAFVSDDPLHAPDGNGNFYQVFVRDLATGRTTRVSSKTNGNQGTDDSGAPSLSHDGRYIAFESDSGGLVTGDGNDSTDVFVRDQFAGTTRRASVTSTGEESYTGGEDPSISSDGRYVAFASTDELVPTDTNGTSDVYVRDLQAGTTTLASVTSGGALSNNWSESPRISGNGRYVAFVSRATNLDGIVDTNNATDVFVRDLVARTTWRVSMSSTYRLAHGAATAPTISGDGRFVSYESTAPDTVGGDTNGAADTFVYDSHAPLTVRTSTDQLGTQLAHGGTRPVISTDGRSVAFATPDRITGPRPSTVGQLYVRLAIPSVTPR
jgi:Tol biopolymer transport system component